MTEPIQGNSVDNVLLEWMLMLVLQKAGRLHRIVPIVLGEAWSDDRVTPSMAEFEDFKKWVVANVPDSGPRLLINVCWRFCHVWASLANLQVP